MSNDPGHIELWGGAECTINRVGDIFYDQHAYSGHRARVEADLELFSKLGLKTLRVALLWERFEQLGHWDEADHMLQAMERSALHPIVGLVHHGSGPSHTHLLDPAFPEKLAAYALQVAQRYPWVTDYTPINEPQTTGRFTCLYGHWFPHHRSMSSYVRSLFHQAKGIVLAIEAIRSVQPHARLIHTEDGGATFATASLQSYEQAREHRRWLVTDLLCGRIRQEHPLFSFLIEHGLAEHEILWFADHACPPSILGINYYVTSDRFLDDRLHLYSAHLPGGDTGTEPLVDIEAVRVRSEGIHGAGVILKQAWERYHLPLAITEAHLGCEPDEQRRWLYQVWRQAEDARMQGIDVRAVTAWGLLGLYNWSCLCTEDKGTYEAGAFDVSSGIPRATPVADLIAQLATGQAPEDERLLEPGWWDLDSRILIGSPVDQTLLLKKEPASEFLAEEPILMERGA